jgi:large subunit ribosomal protein L10
LGVIQKTAKVEKTAALQAKFVEAKGVVLSDYCGLNVQQMSELRRQLRDVSVEFQVVKNTLARRAMATTDLGPLVEHFVGPTAVALAANDVVAMAKALTEFAKKEPKLVIRTGFIEGQLLSSEQVAALAEVPPKEVLLARMLASMQSPLGGFVGVLHGVLRQLLYTLVAIQEAKEKTS